jgi:methionyl-tRNA formyltransferase
MQPNGMLMLQAFGSNQPMNSGFQPVPKGIDFFGLRDLLAKEGGRLLVDVLKGMIGGTVCPFVPWSSDIVNHVLQAKADLQPIETGAPHAPMISQADWTINFSQLTAEQIVWRHRAISHQVIFEQKSS